MARVPGLHSTAHLLSFGRENKLTAQFLPPADSRAGSRRDATAPPLEGAQKKKASAVAGKLSLCFAAFSWSLGRKRNVVTVANRFEDTRTSHVGATRPARSVNYRLVVFFVVFLAVFLDDFLAAFFIAMALVTSFHSSI
jgi:hypothetical protein